MAIVYFVRFMLIFLIFQMSFDVQSQFLKGKKKSFIPYPDATLKLETSFIEGGEFIMGRSSKGEFKDIQSHQVKISSFEISMNEITNTQFREFLEVLNVNRNGTYKGAELIDLQTSGDIDWNNNHFLLAEGRESYPVVSVSWYGAMEFCAWVGGSLPTETQWEYAALGTSQNIYSGSDNIEEVAWYIINSGGSSQPVGQKKPNQFGLFDMTGNVMEWVQDWYQKRYSLNQTTDPIGPSKGKYKSARGGAWNRNETLLRNITRYPLNPGYTNSNLGFRCAFKTI